MSARVPAPKEQQPASFAFTAENLDKAKAIIARYPPRREASAVMPLLDLAQRQNGGWMPDGAVEAIAAMLDMPPIRVLEVATFYSMYKLAPVGKHQINVCTTTPCWLRGSDGISEACKRRLGVGFGETTSDGQFTLSEVECLGACVNAPLVQIGDDYYEDLTPQSAVALVKALRAGEAAKPGSQAGRRSSEPASGAKTLKGEG